MNDPYKLSWENLLNRFEKHGIDGIMPREALELILGFAVSGIKLKELVDRLFERYGDISTILGADIDELGKIEGMTDEALDLLFIMPQLYSLCSTAELYAEGLNDVKKACDYFSVQLQWTPVEQFKLALLDDKFTAKCCVTVGEGSGTEVAIDIGEIVRLAFTMSSRFVIIGHNHPSGSCRPSEADIRSTEALRDTLRTCGIILLDHMIVGVDGVCSMMRSGNYPIRTDKKEIADALKRSEKEHFGRYGDELGKYMR